jgi:AI-2 transport protein TqsA
LVTEFIMVFVFSLLFLFGKNGFARKLIRSFPRPEAKKIGRVLLKIDRDLRKYIGIKSFVSALVGLGTGVILSLFHLEFAVLIGVLTFLLNFIPYLGSIISVIIPVLLAFLQFGTWITPLWIFVCLLAIQNVIAQVLEPGLVGMRLKISIPLVFVALFFWGWLWGASGVLLAVPMTTSIKIIIEDIPIFRPFARMLERSPRRRQTRRRPSGRRTRGEPSETLSSAPERTPTRAGADAGSQAGGETASRDTDKPDPSDSGNHAVSGS